MLVCCYIRIGDIDHNNDYCNNNYKNVAQIENWKNLYKSKNVYNQYYVHIPPHKSTKDDP